jgi:hypothetical protein
MTKHYNSCPECKAEEIASPVLDCGCKEFICVKCSWRELVPNDNCPIFSWMTKEEVPSEKGGDSS